MGEIIMGVVMISLVVISTVIRARRSYRTEKFKRDFIKRKKESEAEDPQDEW